MRRLPSLPRWFQRLVLSRVWLSFLAFGAGTLNLIYLFQANARFISEQGWQAVMDGALIQLVELIVTGVVSMLAYIVFKACEHRLSHWLADE